MRDQQVYRFIGTSHTETGAKLLTFESHCPSCGDSFTTAAPPSRLAHVIDRRRCSNCRAPGRKVAAMPILVIDPTMFGE
jgi:hypothetical protein